MPQHWYYSQYPNPSVVHFAHPVSLLMQDGGLENIWLKDSNYSHHMTRSNKLLSSLNPMIGKEYITFRDKSRGKVVCCGSVQVNESFVLKDVALVLNFISICFLFCNSLRMTMKCAFKKGLSWVLDAQGDLVCRISPLVKFLLLIFHILLSLLDVCWHDLPLRFGSGIGG
jgi:hypothetical protein